MALVKRNTCDVVLNIEDIEAASAIAEFSKSRVIARNCSNAAKHASDFNQKYSSNLNPSIHDKNENQKTVKTLFDTQHLFLKEWSEDCEQACRDSVAFIRRCRQIRGDYHDTLLPKYCFEQKHAEAFNKSMHFLKGFNFIEYRDQNCAKVSSNFRNLINLELYLIHKFGAEPTELPAFESSNYVFQVDSLNNLCLDNPNCYSLNVQNPESSVCFPAPRDIASVGGSCDSIFCDRRGTETNDVGVVPLVTAAGDNRVGGSIDIQSFTSPAYIVYNMPVNPCANDQMIYLNFNQKTDPHYPARDLLYAPFPKACTAENCSLPSQEKNVISTSDTGPVLQEESSVQGGARERKPMEAGDRVEAILEDNKIETKTESATNGKGEVRNLLDRVTTKPRRTNRAASAIKFRRIHEKELSGAARRKGAKAVNRHSVDDCVSADDEPSTLSSTRTSSHHSASQSAKKTRLTVSTEERDILEQFYNQNQYPSRHRYNEIRKIMGWNSSRRITKWFNNRRYNTKQRKRLTV